MFKFFMSLMTPDQQVILKSKHIISINDYNYEIDSTETLKNLKQDFLQAIMKNSKLNKEPNSNYVVSFMTDNKIDISVSIFNREYIIDLLENINKFNELSKFQKLTLS